MLTGNTVFRFLPLEIKVKILLYLTYSNLSEFQGDFFWKQYLDFRKINIPRQIDFKTCAHLAEQKYRVVQKKFLTFSGKRLFIGYCFNSPVTIVYAVSKKFKNNQIFEALRGINKSKRLKKMKSLVMLHRNKFNKSTYHSNFKLKCIKSNTEFVRKCVDCKRKNLEAFNQTGTRERHLFISTKPNPLEDSKIVKIVKNKINKPNGKRSRINYKNLRAGVTNRVYTTLFIKNAIISKCLDSQVYFKIERDSIV